MKITADNRGRIALSKLGAGIVSTPYSEWEGEYKNGKVVLTRAADEEPKEEWGRYDRLTPDDIGTVIGVYSSTPGWPTRISEGENISRADGVFGTLEGYSNVDGQVYDMKFMFKDEVIDLDRSTGFEYFWKKN